MHEPYTTWLLSEEPLSPAQRAELTEHLAQCPACQGLAQAWQRAAADLAALPEASPPVGFLARWDAYAAQQRTRQRRMALALGLGVAVSGLLTLTLAILWLPGHLLSTAQHLLVRLLRWHLSPWPAALWRALRLLPPPLLVWMALLWALGALGLALLWGKALQCAWGLRPCAWPIPTRRPSASSR